MFNFSMEAPSNLFIFFSILFIYFFPPNSCLQGHYSEMRESYQLLPIITGRENERDIRTKRGGREISHVETVVGNDGDEDGIESGRLKWSIRSDQLVVFYGSP